MSDVAVIGMACLFPGAPDLDTYWHNLCAGVDAVREIPAGRWDPVFYDPAAKGADRFYGRRGGFVDEDARFDPARHGIMPVAAKGAEPDQLLALEVATRALADAGYGDRDFARDKTGVLLGRGNYAGPARTRLEQHVRGAEQLIRAIRGLVPSLGDAELAAIKQEFQAALGQGGADAAIGLVPNLTASRIANRLDLGGPAFTLDAACASALVAVDQACAELGSGRCDLVLAGGVHLCQDEAFWSVFCQLGALSRREQIRPFDRRADGLVIGEGIGVFVLKRRTDAERDGDRVYAILRGTGVGSDGREASVMSPSVDGQLLALSRAWRDAGLDPSTIGLVEAHGTATPAGDAAELETLRRFFGPAGTTPRAGLGSVKSMIGHAMPAAGAAGLMKAVLAVYHGVLPPTLHCEEPRAELEATRFRLITEAEPWLDGARVAAVNAFGFGGINAHVVVASAGPAVTAKRRVIPSVLALAAADPRSLLAALETRKTGGIGPCRVVISDPTPERIARARAIIEKGRAWPGRDQIWFQPQGLLATGGKLAFAFPGLDAAFAPQVEDLCAHYGLPLPPGTRPGSIEETGLGIVGVNRLLHRILGEHGVKPDLILGHSIGEWSGMIAAGMIADDVVGSFVSGVRAGTLGAPGVVFAAAGCGRDKATAALDGLSEIVLSHDNCPHQILLCGVEASIDAALARLKGEGVMCQKLPFRSGFHTPLFAEHVAPHRENFARLALRPQAVPLWSATTCAPYPAGPDAVRALAVDHLLKPVRFRELVEATYAAGARVFVQVGTGSVVQFVEDTLRGRPFQAISANAPQRTGLEQLQRLLAALYVEGAEVSFERQRSRSEMTLPLAVPLVELGPRAIAAESLPLANAGPLAAEVAGTFAAIRQAQQDILAQLAPRSSRTVRRLSLESHPELIDHTFFRQPPGWPVVSDRYPVVPMTGLIALLIEAATPLVPGKVVVAVEDVRAFRWLVVSPPVDAVFVATADGDRVRVSFEGYCEGTVVFAAAYPAAPPPAPSALAAERPVPCTPAQFYQDRWMFHGPAYQGVTALTAMGDDGIRGEITTGAALGALLDNAGQLYGYWIMVQNELNRMAMPVAIGRLSFFAPMPRPGERTACSVWIRRHEERAVVADLELERSGKVWCRIDAWEDRRFDTDARLWPVMRFPEENLLAEPRPEGFVVFRDHYRAAPTRDQLHRRFLGERERAAYDAQQPRTQRAWLSGRIAAKDAIRHLLGLPRFPVEIELRTDDRGRPVVVSPPGVQVSIAHKDDLAVALASQQGSPGIDVELIAPRDAAFAETAFTPAELALIGPADDRDEQLTRMWAAKEAAGKARGTGLDGAPHKIPLIDRAGERLLAAGLWVETRREGGHIIAWTVHD